MSYFPLFIPKNRSKFRRNSAASFRSPLNGLGTFPRSPLGAGSAIVTSAGKFGGGGVGGLGGGGVGEHNHLVVVWLSVGSKTLIWQLVVGPSISKFGLMCQVG